MNKLRCILAVARTEYLRWLTDPRVIIVGVLLVFMRSLAVEPLLERAVKFGEKLNILEPFVAVGNSGMLVMLMPCVFLILISDYPKMTGSTLFFIRRTGKTNWFWGQVLFLLMAIATFLLAVLLPLVSMLAVGMPTPAKALCMGAELLTLVSVFTLLQSRWGFASASVAGRFTAVVAAMLCGKMVYYALKAVILAPAVLISTPWTIQLLVMVGVALLFALLQRK